MRNTDQPSLIEATPPTWQHIEDGKIIFHTPAVIREPCAACQVAHRRGTADVCPAPELIEAATRYNRESGYWHRVKDVADWNPHEYTVKREAQQRGTFADHDALYQITAKHGVPRRWQDGRKYRCADLDGYSFWIAQPQLLNRKPIDEAGWID